MIKRSIAALFFCVFELFLKYSESIEIHESAVLPGGGGSILIEADANATNVNEARTLCATHNAILIPLDQNITKLLLLVQLHRRKSKYIKRVFCSKKLIFL